MHYLSEQESMLWQQLVDSMINNQKDLSDCQKDVRSNLYPAFCFYAGCRLATENNDIMAGKKCFHEGTFFEDDGLFMNAFITSFLERQNNKLIMPVFCFEDPAPYVHFTTTPAMKSSRKHFINYFSHTLNKFDKPFKIMDIGTGNGTLLADILSKLLETGKVQEIGEVMIIDASKAMLDLASKTILEKHPDINLKAVHCRIQEFTDHIEDHFDVAMSSLAFHHMPYEDKVVHLKRLKKHIDNFIVFELDANNDTPDMNSPELALAVYSSYGRVIDFVFSHDAPIHVAEKSVDNFLLTEAVSFLTQPRGERTDYHMLRTQWHSLFQESFGGSYECRSDVTCYSDEYLDLFAMHYGLNPDKIEKF